MPGYEIAQLNIGIIRGPMDSPVMDDFAANLQRINALAEASPPEAPARFGSVYDDMISTPGQGRDRGAPPDPRKEGVLASHLFTYSNRRDGRRRQKFFAGENPLTVLGRCGKISTRKD